MLQYSANMVVLGYYMCLPSFEGRGHVRHCQECVRLAPCFDLVELIVALLCITDSAAHACSLRNLTDTCNSIVWPYLQSIEACTSVCSWHQSFDLVELVVALLFIFNNAAHTRGLSYFN